MEFAWVTGNRTPWVEDMSLFVGDAEDIADKSYGYSCQMPENTLKSIIIFREHFTL